MVVEREGLRECLTRFAPSFCLPSRRALTTTYQPSRYGSDKVLPDSTEQSHEQARIARPVVCIDRGFESKTVDAAVSDLKGETRSGGK